jgi:transposase InsO family protein
MGQQKQIKGLKKKMKISRDSIQDIQGAMHGLSGKTAKQMAIQLAKNYDVDVSRIYHYSRDVRPKREQRKDKGVIKAFTEEQFMDMLYYTVNKDKNADLISLSARYEGFDVCPATYNRILRERKLSRKDLKRNITPYRSWEADSPNRLHQIDSTVSQQFYLDDDGSIKHEPEMLRNKNKRGNQKIRLHVVQVIDDHSRVRFARFTLGNHYGAWIQTLYNAWRDKSDPLFPFKGLPDTLYSDNDSVIKSKRFRRAMDILGIELKSHTVGSSQAKGKVERGFRIIQEFEKVTIGQPFKNLEEANAALYDFLIMVNNRVHRSTKEIPFARWIKIGSSQIRNAPSEELFEKLNIKSDTRLIKPNMTIEFANKVFQLPWDNIKIRKHIGEKVEILFYPENEDKIYVVVDDEQFEIAYEKLAIHNAGDYKKAPVLEQQKYIDKVAEMEDPGMKEYGFFADMFGRNYLEKEGVDFDEKSMPSKQLNNLMRTKHWFITTLQDRFILETPIMPVEKRWVESIFKGEAEMPEQELLDIFKKVESGEIIIHGDQSAQAG